MQGSARLSKGTKHLALEPLSSLKLAVNRLHNHRLMQNHKERKVCAHVLCNRWYLAPNPE